MTAPDFTIFNDDPDEWAAYQAWRSATVAAFWQRHGVSVIPVAAFRGAPERWVSPGSVWAVRGPARSSLGSWYREIDAFVDRAEPSRLVVFGNPVAEAICSVPVENRALFSRTCAAAQKEGQNHGR